MSINIAKTRQIYETRDYDQFVMLDANRPIRPAHVRDIMTSIRTYGNLMDVYPLVVVKTRKGKLEIHDGQHRFEACRRLGESVWYIVDESNRLSLRTVRATNTYQRKWAMEDYLDSFVIQKLPEYIRLHSFLNEYPVSLSTGLRLTAGGTRDKYRLDFKVGLYIMAEENFARKVLDMVRDFHAADIPFAWTAPFIAAAAMLARNDAYDHDRMMHKMKIATARQALLETDTTKSTEYVGTLERIYNWQTHAKNVVQFQMIDRDGRRYVAGRWIAEQETIDERLKSGTDGS